MDENVYAVYPVILDMFDLEFNRMVDGTNIFGTFIVIETDSKGKPKYMSDENFKKYVHKLWDYEIIDDETTAELYADFLKNA